MMMMIYHALPERRVQIHPSDGSLSTVCALTQPRCPHSAQLQAG